LARRIVTEIRKGVVPEVAANALGVDLGTWASWMTTRKGRAYRDLRAQVEQAEAVAKADYMKILHKQAKGGAVRAVQLYLQSRASQFFPPRAPVSLTQHNTLIAQIQAMEAREGTLPDPRLALPPVQDQPALPENVTPEGRTFEAVGYLESRPDVIDLAPVPAS
jgi:hypothetical protein